MPETSCSSSAARSRLERQKRQRMARRKRDLTQARIQPAHRPVPKWSAARSPDIAGSSAAVIDITNRPTQRVQYLSAASP
jgi:hypothetical protein